MIKNLYTSPIYTGSSSSDLLQDIKKYISIIPKTNEIRGNSTVGGYQSDTKIFSNNSSSINSLKALISEEVQKYWPILFEALSGREFSGKGPQFELWGWLTSLRAGGFNSPHIHPRSTISGVYYINTPSEIIENLDGSFAGWIGFMDPRSNSQIWPISAHLNYYYVPPVEGSLILFPSYLQHFVPPFNSAGERTAIAFNLRHKIV
jgi:uncharacterized protein (TIGR02466 family)